MIYKSAKQQDGSHMKSSFGLQSDGDD